MSEKPQILLDMDGVLADFDSGAARAHGVDPRDLQRRRKPGNWCIVAPMGEALGRKLSLEEFWEPINAMGEQFWAELQPTPHAYRIAAQLRMLFGEETDLRIATSPSSHPGCIPGKLLWLSEFFKRPMDRWTIFANDKSAHAAPNRILVDDRTENVEGFSQAGGYGVIFPHIGNMLSRWRDDPLPYVVGNLTGLLQFLKIRSETNDAPPLSQRQ